MFYSEQNYFRVFLIFNINIARREYNYLNILIKKVLLWRSGARLLDWAIFSSFIGAEGQWRNQGKNKEKEKDITQAEQQTEQEQAFHFFPFNRPTRGITWFSLWWLESSDRDLWSSPVGLDYSRLLRTSFEFLHTRVFIITCKYQIFT